MAAPFEELLDRYQKEIYRFACRMTGNADDGADVLQDTFMRAFRAFPRLPAEANHRAWLYRIAGRSAMNLVRSKKGQPTLPLDAASHVEELNSNTEAQLERRRLTGILEQTLRKLSIRQRTALIQRKYEGLSYAEIAATLGCSEQAARAHVYQALDKVRREMARVRS